MAEPNQPIHASGYEATKIESDNIWPKKAEDIFISLMEEEVNKGNRQTTTFTTNAWKTIRSELNKRTGRNYTQLQLKNKFNGLRGRLRTFTKIISQTGISYSPVTNMVSASDEQWQKLEEVIRNAKRFRKKGCPNYQKLCIIFGDTTATGVHAHASTQSPSISEEEDNNEKTDELGAGGDVPDEIGKKKKANIATSSGTTQKKDKWAIQCAVADALTVMSEISKRKLDLAEKINESSQSTIGLSKMSQQAHVQSFEACVETLDALEDIDDASYAKAIKLFNDGEGYRLMFLKMNPKRRRNWVLNSI